MAVLARLKSTGELVVFTKVTIDDALSSYNGDLILQRAGVTKATFSDTTGISFTDNVTAPLFVGALNGNANTASKWATARTITLGGDLSGSVSLDGSSNVTLTGSVVDNSHNHSNYTPFSTLAATTVATAGWYRIATSAVNIGANSGLFKVEFNGTGVMGRCLFIASCHNGTAAGSAINQLGFTTTNGNLGLTQARVVYHTTYTGNYAYVEVYNPTALAITYTVDLIDSTGWVLTTPNTVGSIPTGYTNEALIFDTGYVSMEDVTANRQLISKVATGTAPLVVSSTTKVTNLNAEMVDGLHTGGSGVANTLVYRDSSGYIQNTWYNSNRGEENSTAASYIYDTGDGYMRKKSVANVRAELGATANTASTLVLRDTSGNFSAGTISATLSGNASTATKLQTARAINGVNFDGSANITIADSTKLPLTGGTMTGALTLSSDPTADLHAVPRRWVQGRPAKDSARVASTADIGASTATATTLTGYGTSQSLACTTTAGSTTITTTSTAGLKIGAIINTATTQLAAGTTVATIASATSFTVNNRANIATTAITGTGSTATATFAAQTYAPYAVGSSITISGATPTTYNGTFVVTACTTTSVSWNSTETTTATVQGTIAFTIVAGTSITTTFTQTIAALTMDGLALVAGDRVLLKNQTATAQNGIYDVINAGSTSVAWILTRSAGGDTWGDLVSALIGVDDGTTNKETLWQCTVNNGGTLGTTAINWQLVSNSQIAALGNFTATGLIARTAANTFAGRAIAVSGTGLTVSNGNGVSGNPTITSNATNANTASTIVARDASGNFTAGTISATLSGNAATATKLATTRNIALTGSVTGNANFDGSGNISIATTTNHGHIVATQSVDGYMSSSDKTKLDNISLIRTGSRNYAGFEGFTQIDLTDATNYNIIITSNETSNGELGEVWIIKETTCFKVYNSGAATSLFDYIIVPVVMKGIITGSGNMAGLSNYTQINFDDLGKVSYTVHIIPTTTTEGRVGEFYVIKETNNFKIYNTGSYTGNFDYTIFY
jgi:hypothetical protein